MADAVFKKVTLYRLADGRTVNTLAEARSEGLKADTMTRMAAIVEQKGLSMTGEQRSMMRATINGMIDVGWRPPAKKYASTAKAKK